MISAKITGVDQVKLRFTQLPANLVAALAPTMETIGVNLVTYVVQQELSGQILNRRSGKLSNAITYQPQPSSPTMVGVKAGVFGGVPYARALEYGFDGPEHVRAFTRTVTKVFGREVAPTEQQVRAFTRQMHLPAFGYMRKGLAAQKDSIIALITKGVRQAVA